jgi:large subunit ribosomal protein L3
MPFIVGEKLKMSQIWLDGKVTPVTLVKAAPMTVSAIKSKEKDGYVAVQVASSDKKIKREFRNFNGDLKIGDNVSVANFSEGMMVKVQGISKGKGFQGVVKRHGFSGGPKTHGQKNRYRMPGSIGSTAPQRVTPGRRMAGRMGGDKITIKNLKIVGIDKENNILMIKGALPGKPGTILKIESIS